ncbi:hypothetical protein HY375_01940 [Candidatus Berkelbacteria bacterium]|nr:hypothetical protein [Candidatus Berkelbacteria bacterium]
MRRYVPILTAGYLIFLAFAILLPGKVESPVLDTLLSIATFTFAILLGFSISQQNDRLSSLRTTLREMDGQLFSLRQLTKVFDADEAALYLGHVDRYLQAQLDYRLTDFTKTLPELQALNAFILSLKVKTDRQRQLLDHMLYELRDLLRGHSGVTHNVQDEMPVALWLSLLVLSAILWAGLILINDGTTTSLIIVPILSESILLLLIILHDLDRLTWQERDWIWRPLIELFQTLDLVPYFPEALFADERLTQTDVDHLKAYRVVHYPEPYPDFSNKQIQLVQPTKTGSDTPVTLESRATTGDS